MNFLNTIRIRNRTVFIFLLLTGILAYFNSFDVPFHYDDFYYLKENLKIKSFKIFVEWVSGDYSKIFTARPFLLFTFFLNYKLGGLDTLGYHLLNLLFHVVNAFLLYLLFYRYDEAEPPFNSPLAKGGHRGVGYSLKYLLAAVLFLIHPINTESVTYLSSRSSVLSAFFVLASMLCFFRATTLSDKSPQPPKNITPPSPPLNLRGGWEGLRGGEGEVIGEKVHAGYYTLSILFFILGLSTKEIAIVLFPLLMLFDYFFISKNSAKLLSRLKYYLPYIVLVISLFSVYLRYVSTPEIARPWATHIFTELGVFVKYIKLLLIPVGLNIDHDVKPSVFIDGHVIFSSLVILSLIFMAVRLKKRLPVISFSILWFFISVAPFLVIRLNDLMAERWLYIASMGFSVGLSGVLIHASNYYRKACIVLIAAGIIFYSTLTVMRNHVYTSQIYLWEDSVEKSPDKSRPYFNLSRAYMERGYLLKAIETTEKGLKLGGGDSVGAYINLSVAYKDLGDYEKAIKVLETIEGKASNYYEYYHNLGAIYVKMDEYEKALSAFEKALKIHPNSPLILFSIGESYENLSQEEKAREYFMLATQKIPQNAQEYMGQGVAFFKLGDGRKALECFYESIKSDPLDVNVRIYLANTLLGNGYANKAFRHYSIAAEIAPNYTPAYTGMGKAMLATGNLKEARKHFNKALSLLPPGSPERKELLELLDKTKG